MLLDMRGSSSLLTPMTIARPMRRLRQGESLAAKPGVEPCRALSAIASVVVGLRPV